MNKPLLTEAARRSLDEAKRLADQWGQAVVQSGHLLWALLHDESLASEWLLEHSVTVQRIHDSELLNDLLPETTSNVSSNLKEGVSNKQTAADLEAEEDPVVASLTREMKKIMGEAFDAREPIESGDLQQVLRAAGRAVRWDANADEIGSEHLLAGLASVESPISRFLLQHGGEALVVDSQSAATGNLSEPMDVEFEIDLVSDHEDSRTETFRILDAAANRAREGLRVAEDFVRFALDDPHLSSQLKNIRHRLSTILQRLGGDRLVQARDTRGDVGTEISTAAENRRADGQDVLNAAVKRAQEAARTLEEFSKVVGSKTAPDDTPVFEQLAQIRYELYTIEKAVVTSSASRDRLVDCGVYLLLTSELCMTSVEEVVRGAIAAGVRIIQVRQKSMPDRELLAHARQIRELTAPSGTLFIMNDRPDLAALADADGVHVGQEELSVRDARRIAGPDRLVGVSTHSIEQARQAVMDGANYIGVGPVFRSKTKSFDKFAGLKFVRQVADEISLPAFAIGGINSTNLEHVVDAGSNRVAVSAAICGADDPLVAADDLVRALASR